MTDTFEIVLVRVTVAVIKHHNQKQLGEEKVYSTHSSTQLIAHHQKQQGQEFKQGKNLGAGNSCRSHGGECCLWTCYHGLLRLLSYEPRTTTPGIALLIMVWAYPHQTHS